MKILHTADLHLGKRLCGTARLDEQREVMSEIAQIADFENVDIILAAGDIFDTSVPSAEAEELFYASCLELAKNRIFVAVSGNHDDPQRFAAPSGIAKQLNIILAGGTDYAAFSRKGIVGGDGYLKIDIGGEKLNLALLPYPQMSMLSNKENKELNYTQLVAQRLQKICSNFSADEFNVICSHLFSIKDGEDSDGLNFSDEYELGAAALIPSSVFPRADYTALGHVHKPFCVSRSRNIYYSGSILQYSFDDTNEKSVIICQLTRGADGNKNTLVKRVPLQSGKKLIKLRANSFEEACRALEENPQKKVCIVYEGQTPLALSETAALKKYPAFTALENQFMAAAVRHEYKNRTDSELFSDFYKFRKGGDAEPSEELTDMFLKVLSGVREEEL